MCRCKRCSMQQAMTKWWSTDVSDSASGWTSTTEATMIGGGACRGQLVSTSALGRRRLPDTRMSTFMVCFWRHWENQHCVIFGFIPTKIWISFTKAVKTVRTIHSKFISKKLHWYIDNNMLIFFSYYGNKQIKAIDLASFIIYFSFIINIFHLTQNIFITKLPIFSNIVFPNT